MFQLIKIFGESVKLAVQEIVGNKLRSGLSLLGITIGIFCIISIFTGVDFLKTSIDDGFKELGQEVLYVDKYPWEFSDSNYPWWEYQKRPQISYQNFKQLKENLTTAESISFMAGGGVTTLKSNNNAVKGVKIIGTSPTFQSTLSIAIKEGRFFSELEGKGAKVAVIGNELAEGLFPNQNPIGQTFKLKGHKIKIIGVIKSSDNLINVIEFDNDVLMPFNALKSIFKISKNSNTQIAVKAKEGSSVEAMKQEIRGILRGSRELRPIQRDNFALNRVTMILEQLGTVKGQMNIVGFLLGFLSLLIGGFGVANIMFVSVKERTKYIGIKKAIGARKWMILTEFLVESIILCIIGSLVGLFLVFALSKAASSINETLKFTLSARNILVGIGISVFIGILAGFIPALQAANMNPVKAIRS